MSRIELTPAKIARLERIRERSQALFNQLESMGSECCRIIGVNDDDSMESYHAHSIVDITASVEKVIKRINQLRCDHEWEAVDDSFDHAFGVRTIKYERCERCGLERDSEREASNRGVRA